MRKSAGLATAAASAAWLLCAAAQAGQAWRFHLEEATIADVHRAIRAKQITATRLVQNYFKRIEAYNGTCVKGGIDAATGLQLGEITPVENAGQLNAYMTLNVRGKRSKTDTADNDPKLPDALEVARAQDAYFARTGKFVGPLHGIPVAIKDNYDTVDQRTTAGAAADYANDKPPMDATMVAKLRAAGAIILGKTNLDEYAPAGIARSGLGGQTCNPYDTKRIPGAVNSLVGMLATQGVVSRAGIVPLSLSRDRGGPLCRTVEDTAIMLEVVTGYDPRDHITSATYGKKLVSYRNYANKKSLAGKRLGVVRELMVEATLADRDSIRVANEAIAEMKKLGATIVDPVNVQAVIADLVPYLEPSILTQSFPSSTPSGAKPIDQAVLIAADPKLLPGGARGVNLRMLAAQRRGEEGRYALNRYLRERGDAKFKTVEDMFATPTFLGNIDNLKAA